MVISEDKNFRPIAIHFGPDGCLYVVDWYNPIISHNEVPRNHPDRDKTHSRIWRIRHTSQEYSAPRDVTAVADADLPALLDAPSTWESRAAWHQIADRQAQSLSTELERMATDDGIRTPARVLALWCLEDLGHVRLAVLKPLFRSAEPALRREAARLCAALDSESLNWEAVLGWARAETDPRVRFVGGVRGTAELERLVDSGRAAVAFSLAAVSVSELLAIADAGAIMPPKSTWFEPKLRDGLLTHLI